MIQIQPKSLKLSWLCVVNQSVHQLETRGACRNYGLESSPGAPGRLGLRPHRSLWAAQAGGRSGGQEKCRLQLLALSVCSAQRRDSDLECCRSQKVSAAFTASVVCPFTVQQSQASRSFLSQWEHKRGQLKS